MILLIQQRLILAVLFALMVWLNSRSFLFLSLFDYLSSFSLMVSFSWMIAEKELGLAVISFIRFAVMICYEEDVRLALLW